MAISSAMLIFFDRKRSISSSFSTPSSSPSSTTTLLNNSSSVKCSFLVVACLSLLARPSCCLMRSRSHVNIDFPPSTNEQQVDEDKQQQLRDTEEKYLQRRRFTSSSEQQTVDVQSGSADGTAILAAFTGIKGLPADWKDSTPPCKAKAQVKDETGETNATLECCGGPTAKAEGLCTGAKANETTCEWAGVTCAAGKVIGIELEGGPELVGSGLSLQKLPKSIQLLSVTKSAGLTGPTTFEITEGSAVILAALTYLDLSDNKLIAPQPDGVPDFEVAVVNMKTLCPNLLTLRLASNNFAGTFSNWAAVTTSLPKLQHFDVSSNKLIGTVPQPFFKSGVTATTTLKSLDISKNGFHGKIGSFSELPASLTSLFVEPTLASLPEGKSLCFSPEVKVIPEQLNSTDITDQSLTQQKCPVDAQAQAIIDAFGTGITGLPSNWKVHQNPCSDTNTTIECCGGPTARAEGLCTGADETTCEWTGVTCAAGKVIGIELEGGLVGSGLSLQKLPKSIQLLSVTKNAGLTGSTTFEISEGSAVLFAALTYLDLSGNKLDAPEYAGVPYFEFDIINMKTLCPNLLTLFLASNAFSGTFNNWAAVTTSLPKLEHFDVSSNKLTGPFPAPFFKSGVTAATTLKSLNISQNGFYGEISSFSELPTSLTSLYVVPTPDTAPNGALKMCFASGISIPERIKDTDVTSNEISDDLCVVDPQAKAMLAAFTGITGLPSNWIDMNNPCSDDVKNINCCGGPVAKEQQMCAGAEKVTCEWTGVTCRQGKVTGVEFNGNSSLKGSGLSLQQLPQTVLLISVTENPGITGQSAFDISSSATSGILNELSYIDLSGNKFSTPQGVDSPDFSIVINNMKLLCPNLLTLRLASNDFAGTYENWTAMVTSLPKLEHFDVSSNNLIGTVPEPFFKSGVTAATTLKSLDISKNGFYRDIDSLSELPTSLTSLYVEPTPANLPKGESLCLSPEIKAIPKQLTSTDITEQSLTQKKCPVDAQAQAIIDAFGTGITGLPSNWVSIHSPCSDTNTTIECCGGPTARAEGMCTGADETTCEWTGVTCAAGKVIGIELTKSTTPDLKGDTFNLRSLPATIRQVSLTYFGAALTGSNTFVLSSTDKSLDLLYLDLTGNGFQSPLIFGVPVFAVAIQNLQTLCPNLVRLLLGKNAFSGTYENWTTTLGLTKLERIDLSSNSLTGSFPTPFFKKRVFLPPSVILLDISSNGFYGEIDSLTDMPTSMSSLTMTKQSAPHGATPPCFSNDVKALPTSIKFDFDLKYLQAHYCDVVTPQPPISPQPPPPPPPPPNPTDSPTSPPSSPSIDKKTIVLIAAGSAACFVITMLTMIIVFGKKRRQANRRVGFTDLNASSTIPGASLGSSYAVVEEEGGIMMRDRLSTCIGGRGSQTTDGSVRSSAIISGLSNIGGNYSGTDAVRSSK